MDTTEFVIEKNTAPLPSRVKSINNPNFYRIQLTMAKMDKEDAFTYALNGTKDFTLKNWVKVIEKNLNNNIVDKITRDKNPFKFSCVLIKDDVGKPSGMRIRRDN